MESIINFLATGPKSTFDFRDEFGVYPRSKLNKLYEQERVIKSVIRRRVIWSLRLRSDEEIQQEIIDKFADLVSEVESNPINVEASQKLMELKGELEQITDNYVFKGIKLVGSE